MAKSMDLPAGFRFYPNDKELLSHYLKPKVNGETLPCDVITEKQIYGRSANPWDVFDDSSTPWIIWDNLKIVYAFTPLKKIAVAGSSGGGGSKKKENYAKKAGCGTWHGQTSREPIKDDDDRVLGFRRLLSFQINDIDHVDFNQVGHWLMHEYVLCGFEDYALCRITVDMSKNAKVKKLFPPKTCKKTTAKVCRSCTSTDSKDYNEIKATTSQAAQDKNKQVLLNESQLSEIVDNLGSSGVEEKDNLGIVDNLGSSGVEEKDYPGLAVDNLGSFGVEEKDYPGFAVDNLGSSGVEEKNNPGFAVDNLGSFGVEEKDYPGFAVDNLGSFGVEEKDYPGFAASTQALTAEETLQFLMNDSEDFENFGIEELSNFCGGYMDVTSFDFESFLGDGSWFDVAELVDDVSNNNNVQTVQNMSGSKALGKRKAFGAQEDSGPSKKLCM